jgi:hypothetical protein
MTYLTCDIPLVLYFWAHWGHCAILVWGWGRHYLFAFLLFSFLYFCIFVVLCIKFNVDYISLVCFNFD